MSTSPSEHPDSDGLSAGEADAALRAYAQAASASPDSKPSPGQPQSQDPSASGIQADSVGTPPDQVTSPPMGNGEQIDEVTHELLQTQENRIAELTEELARANAAYYNKDQEYANYVRRTKEQMPAFRLLGIAEVANSLLGALDDIALAREHGDLVGAFASVAQNLESTLETRFGLMRYGQVGQAFDPTLHEAIQMLEPAENEETLPHVIKQVAQPGYILGEQVLRAAMVIVGHGEITLASDRESIPQVPAEGDGSQK